MPLSEREEQLYLERLKEGDEAAKNVLIERNLRLVAHIVKKFDNTGEDMDDLISIGTIGLIKAINTFDVAKKIRLATYAARCIENEILMFLRRSNKIKGEILLKRQYIIEKRKLKKYVDINNRNQYNKKFNNTSLTIRLLTPFNFVLSKNK